MWRTNLEESFFPVESMSPSDENMALLISKELKGNDVDIKVSSSNRLEVMDGIGILVLRFDFRLKTL